MIRKHVLRVAAAVAAFTLAGGSLVAANTASAANIDPNATGSITVHKHAAPVTGQDNSGKEINVTNPVLQGVEFTVNKINVDLVNDPAQWGAAETGTWKDANHVAGSSSLKGAKVASIETDATGKAVFSNLPVGAYLVRETSVVNAKDAAGNPVAVAYKTAPFVVTVPLPQADGSFLYDVHTYPKNTVAEGPTKTVNNDELVKAGDYITYTIEEKIPEKHDGGIGEYDDTKWWLWDNLDDRLEIQTDPSQLDVELYVNDQKITEILNHNGSSELPTWDLMNVDETVAAHFQFHGCSVPPSNYDSSIASDANLAHYGENKNLLCVTVVAEDSKGKSILPGSKIKVVIKAKVLDSGVIQNYAYTAANRLLKTNTVVTEVGRLNVLKTDAASPAKPLAGAVFEVYQGSGCTGSKVDLEAAKTTTGDNGKFASDVILKAGSYSVKEVTAPLGYVIGANSCTNVSVVADENDAALVSTVAVINHKAVVPGLPLTGSQAQTILLATAGVLLAVGVGVIVYRRRQTA